MKDSFFKEVLSLIYVPFTVVILLLIIIAFFEIQFSVPVKCYVDDVLVYDDLNVGLKIKSAGDNTIVRTYGGVLYGFPRKIYVSKNVRVIGVK